MQTPSLHLLVIGSGSVGKRHARNFSSLGCRISCTDPRVDRRHELAKETPVEQAYPAPEAALSSGMKFDGAIVCSPPSFHEQQTLLAFANGLPVFLEKPATPDLAACANLARAQQSSGLPLLLGYTWRWWPPLAKLRQLLDAGTIGTPLSVHFFMSAHLADWHPWERYQDFFMASQAQGGGALLDESHWIDLMLWLFGMPQSVYGRVDKLSPLEIDSDDNVDLIATYGNNLRANIHLDIYGRPHEKYIRLIGEKGSILWTAEPNRIVMGDQASGWTETFEFDCERNDMFLAAAREFLELLKGGGTPRCSIEDGVNVLRMVEAVRTSCAAGKTIELSRN